MKTIVEGFMVGVAISFCAGTLVGASYVLAHFIIKYW